MKQSQFQPVAFGRVTCIVICTVIGCAICLQVSDSAMVLADEGVKVHSRVADQRPLGGKFNELLEQPIQEYFLPLSRTNGEPARLSPFRRFTHLSTEFGLMGPESETVRCSDGSVRIDLSEAAEGDWAGVWHRLVAADQPGPATFDFSRCYGQLVDQRFQPRCVGVRLRARGNGSIRLEIKSPDEQVLWQQDQPLEGEFRIFDWSVDPDSLTGVGVINWLVEQPTKVEVESFSLLLEFPPLTFPEQVFLISYAKLARCYSPENGVVKDKLHVPIGKFDCVPTSGMFCLATCAAWRMGMIDRRRALDVLHSVHRTISDIERAYGLAPHFIFKSEGMYRIAVGTEFSTADTSLYYHSMALAAHMLNEHALLSKLKREIESIDFAYLVDEQGYVIHGLKDDGKTKLASHWSDFGGETVLVGALYRMAIGEKADLRMESSGRVFRGRGFIAELQSLFYPQFATEKKDLVSGVDWMAMRTRMLRDQREYIGRHWPESTATKIGIYGLSAGESFRSLGYESNGTEDADVRLLHPHYMLMAGQLDPDDTLDRLRRLQQHGLLPPWGLVENVRLNASVEPSEYSPMTSSLNASFEAIGAYHLWAAESGQKNDIYASAQQCELTRTGIQEFYP